MDEVMGLVTVALRCPLSTAYCSTHLMSWERTTLSPSLEGGCIWPDVCYRCSEGILFQPRGLVIPGPCQPQGKDLSLSYFAINLILNRRVCPWQAFYLGETVSLLLLFHVKLILMQHLLIQKHSVLQAKKIIFTLSDSYIRTSCEML